ncbi:MAG: glycoside hydrolase family 2 protein [Fimbriimonas sp.]
MRASTFDWDAPAAQTPRPEYPRPRLVRDNWLCLNGLWEFALDRSRSGLTNGWNDGHKLPGKIVVPFAYQYALSGRNDKAVDEVVWYARSFDVPKEWLREDQDLLLHFGAVDYRCVIWVNGKEIGHNEGGHVPFWFDIKPFVKAGENRVTVRVEDLQDPSQPRGKQASFAISRGCDYYCTTGIWQTVWLEPVPSVRIEDLIIQSYLAVEGTEDSLNIRVLLHAPALHTLVRIRISKDGEEVTVRETRSKNASAEVRIPIPNAFRWSPESPHLYDIEVTLVQDGQEIDRLKTYAGIRCVEALDGQILLNGEPIYQKLVLDQGYWPESGMTAPTDDALRADVEWCKRFGFNGARKHQKVEDPRWLYWCDKLGLLVWGEMANARAWSPTAEECFLTEWERAVRRDVSHPCIITWVPLNESWGVPSLGEDHPGQYSFVERLVTLTRRIDSTRPVIDNDGWEHTDVTDIFAVHDYTPTGADLTERYKETLAGGPMLSKGWGRTPKTYFAVGAKYRGQPVILSEVGGFLLAPPNVDKRDLDPLYQSYGSTSGAEELLRQYRDIMEAIARLPFVVGFCYTQLTDVEQETNGLLTYDRREKIDPKAIAQVHADMDRIRQ